MSVEEKPAAVLAIEAAYAEAEAARKAECERVARWIAQTGWRLGDEHFEDEIGAFRRLADGDVAEFREFRAQLIEKHART